MLGSKKIGILTALIALSACNQPGYHNQGQPEVQAFEIVGGQDSTHVANPNVIRDTSTGCEYLVFRTKFGISVVPRMEPYGLTERLQICKDTK